jgi:hypothetical protein
MIPRWQTAGKPGFVEDDHLSSQRIAASIKRVATDRRIAFDADLLAADRVYLLHVSPHDAVGSYPTHFTLTPVKGRYCFCGTFPRVASGRR